MPEQRPFDMIGFWERNAFRFWKLYYPADLEDSGFKPSALTGKPSLQIMLDLGYADALRTARVR